jgi:hypothetical protein
MPPGRSGDDESGGAEDSPGEPPGRDPELRAMRAVWQEMRDEDPPDRGIADLLAAARGRAAAMQPAPSTWQRVLALLRRPPLLALATATVLIAGAVLIGRRVPDRAAPAPAVAPPAPVALRSSSDPRAGSARDAPGVDPASAGPGRSSPAAELSAPVPVPAGIADRTSAATPPVADIGDLHRRCETAARRGDCATVRRLVGRILRTDPGYRARLAPSSPIGACLAE